jgi:hypothetical protein
VCLPLVALLAAPTGTRAEAGLTFSFSPAALELQQPSVAEIQVDSAPEATGYRFDLGYDPSVVALTSVAPGDFLASAGQVEFTPQFTAEGVLHVTATLLSAPAGGSYPSGSGTLALVTFAPLGVSSSTAVTLSGASLVGADGQEMAASGALAGQVTVMEPAPPAEQTAAVAQATALASELGEAPGQGGGAGGVLSGLTRPNLPRPGSTAIWLGLLAAAVLLALVSWAVGRRPPAGGPGR